MRCRLAYPYIGKQKVTGGCAHLGADIQKPYAPKYRQRKIKIDLLRDFLQKSAMPKLLILFQLKFPHYMYVQRVSKISTFILTGNRTC
jgi:hypothetical protein